MEQEPVQRKDYGELFGTNLGQRVLHDLMLSFHYESPMYRLSTPQSGYDTVFREGQRSVILWLNDMVRAALADVEPPESYNPNEVDSNG